MGKLHQLSFEQKVPASIDDVWDFISSPLNLKEITPSYMKFEVISNLEDNKMYPGQVIGYKISPIMGIKFKWITEITHVNEKEYFVDEQRVGPYKFWHHKHFIHSIERGVVMQDVIDYIMPLGVIGEWANSLFVKNQLIKIFEYRSKKMEEIFGKYNEI